MPLQVPTAASKWDHNFLGSIGMAFRRIDLFDQFFDIDPPMQFGVGLDQHLEAYVHTNVQRVRQIGLRNVNRLTDTRNTMPFQHDVLNFFQAENNVMTYYPAEESAVDEFAKAVLNLLGFNLAPNINVHGPAAMSTSVGGTAVSAIPGIVVTNRSQEIVVLIVQEDKSLLSNVPRQNAIAQLMAEALAAFTHDNLEAGYQQQTVYGILLRGTVPLFFKIPMTIENVSRIQRADQAINDLLIEGQYYCPHNDMNEVGYLRTADEHLLEFFQCFEAMRRMAIHE